MPLRFSQGRLFDCAPFASAPLGSARGTFAALSASRQGAFALLSASRQGAFALLSASKQGAFALLSASRQKARCGQRRGAPEARINWAGDSHGSILVRESVNARDADCGLKLRREALAGRFANFTRARRAL